MKLDKISYVLIGLILVIGFLMFVMCKTKSKFGEKTSVAANIKDDTVFIFFAPWCGYCKEAKTEFKKSVAEGNGKVVLVDATLPENKKLAEEYKVKGFPTIIKSNGTKYTGARTAAAILSFAGEDN